MPRKKQSELIAEEIEILRAEIQLIHDSEDPTDEDVQRAEELKDDLEEKTIRRSDVLEREARLEQIFRASQDENRVARTDRGPEIIRRQDPFDVAVHEELKRSLWTRGPFDPNETISRAQMAIDRGPRHVDDDAKGRLHELLELDNQHAPLIARHMLMTGSPRYHEQFKEYVASRGTYVGELLRTAMSLTDANGGRVAALAG